ncbi:MAG TPA: sulfur carrier protein ThiS [Candidatus Acidoferrales bacterium]|nr:sulfur carrier protein ThiS [Candidatus Acidoferrales bacterium]
MAANPMTRTLRVTINGEAREVPAGLTVRHLLGHLGLDAGRVAVERNLEILPRERWDSTAVQPADRFEIVHFVGGG